MTGASQTLPISSLIHQPQRASEHLREASLPCYVGAVGLPETGQLQASAC